MACLYSKAFAWFYLVYFCFLVQTSGLSTLILYGLTSLILRLHRFTLFVFQSQKLLTFLSVFRPDWHVLPPSLQSLIMTSIHLVFLISVIFKIQFKSYLLSMGFTNSPSIRIWSGCPVHHACALHGIYIWNSNFQTVA